MSARRRPTSAASAPPPAATPTRCSTRCCGVGSERVWAVPGWQRRPPLTWLTHPARPHAPTAPLPRRWRPPRVRPGRPGWPAPPPPGWTTSWLGPRLRSRRRAGRLGQGRRGEGRGGCVLQRGLTEASAASAESALIDACFCARLVQTPTPAPSTPPRSAVLPPVLQRHALPAARPGALRRRPRRLRRVLGLLCAGRAPGRPPHATAVPAEAALVP